jgi:bifunctional non-homologous end joining protein LigD
VMAGGGSRLVELDGHEIKLSNLHKPYFPEQGITKGDVVDYYRRIADVMLPHVTARPLVLQRFPDGIEGSGFFQKNTPDHVPDWIERLDVETATGGSTSYSVIGGSAGLVYLVGQGAITIHTLLSASDAPTRPIEVIFDLDPADDDLEPVRQAAFELRHVLDELDLAPRVKSSGSRGLHVVVDVIDSAPDFDLTSAFARRIAELVVERGPFTLAQRKRDRDGRLFIDVLRNAPANHAVAPYSLRPLPEAPVAAPLQWHEALDRSFHPRRITLDNVFRRLGRIGDPWADVERPDTTIAQAMALLEPAG